MSDSGGLRKRLTGLATDENLDLWLLTVAALVFTMLGVIGVANQAVLASAILALLALMATAQVRSRRHVADIARAQRVDPTALLRKTFPPDMRQRCEQSRDVLLIGTTLAQTIQTYHEALRRSLSAGARVRVMVVDPDLQAMLHVRQAPLGLHGRERIDRFSTELAEIRRELAGNLEVRVSPFPPSIGVTAFDITTAHGLIVVQHYEFRADD